jgi:hypothetical protein
MHTNDATALNWTLSQLVVTVKSLLWDCCSSLIRPCIGRLQSTLLAALPKPISLLPELGVGSELPLSGSQAAVSSTVIPYRGLWYAHSSTTPHVPSSQGGVLDLTVTHICRSRGAPIAGTAQTAIYGDPRLWCRLQPSLL